MNYLLYPFYIFTGLLFAVGGMIALGMAVNVCMAFMKGFSRPVYFAKMFTYALGAGVGGWMLWMINYITSCIGSRTDYYAQGGIAIGVILSLVLTVPGLIAIIALDFERKTPDSDEKLEVVI